MCAVLERCEEEKEECSWLQLLDVQWAQGCLDCPHVVQKGKKDLERGEERGAGGPRASSTLLAGTRP